MLPSCLTVEDSSSCQTVTGSVLARIGYRVRIVIFVALAGVLLAGCGSRVIDRSRSATPPYDGQLGAGAAVGALECEGKTPYDDVLGVYDDGLAKVQGSAEAALDDYMSESGLSFSTPSEGYAVERDQDGRVLFSYDVDGRTKVAIFAANDVRDWNRDEGWGRPRVGAVRSIRVAFGPDGRPQHRRVAG
jgi:uncharacterized protein YceK